MNRFLYIFFFSGLFATAELFLRSWGILFPLTGFFVFYSAITFGNSPGFFCAVICGMALDFCSGAEHPWSILTFLAVIYLSSQWIHKVESDSIMLNFLPGLAIPFITFAGDLIFSPGRFFSVLCELLPGVLPAAAGGAVTLPVMIYLMDTLNPKLSMPLYIDAKLRRKPL